MPEPKELHVDSVLSDLSIKYRNEAFLWRDILPLVDVNKRSNKYPKYAKADSYTLPDDKVGPKSMPNEVDWSVDFDFYAVKDHALADWISVEEMENADPPINVEIDTNEFLNDALELAQEKRAADLVFDPTTYPTGNKVQLAGAAQWSDAGSDPIKDIMDAIEGCFVRANTLIFGAQTWFTLRRHAKILDAVKAATRFQGSGGGLATQPEVAALFEVERVLVGRSRYNTANPGQNASFARLWGKHAAAVHVAPGTTGIKTITFGKTFVEQPRLTFRDFDGKRGVKGAVYLKVAWNSDEKIIASDLGYLIQDAIA